MSEPTGPKKYIRFSLGGLLFAVLCVAGIFAGYFNGFESGYSSGVSKRDAEKPYAKVYSIGEIADRVSATGSVSDAGRNFYDYLMSAIETTISPSEWEALGGNATLAIIPGLNCILVHATSDVHDQLEEFLKDLDLVSREMKIAASEQDEWAKRNEQYLKGITETATRIAGQPASLVPADFTLIGTWNVSKPPNDGPKVIAKYEFIDDDTVRITDDVSSLDPPIDAFYFIQGPRTAIRGAGYFVAVTESGMVVLVNTKDETNSLVAEQLVER